MILFPAAGLGFLGLCVPSPPFFVILVTSCTRLNFLVRGGHRKITPQFPDSWIVRLSFPQVPPPTPFRFPYPFPLVPVARRVAFIYFNVGGAFFYGHLFGGYLRVFSFNCLEPLFLPAKGLVFVLSDAHLFRSFPSGFFSWATSRCLPFRFLRFYLILLKTIFVSARPHSWMTPCPPT